MSDWQAGFYEALANYVRASGRDDVVKVVDFDETTYGDRGGCPTCGPFYEYEATIWYEDSAGERKFYDYDGTFADLVKALTD